MSLKARTLGAFKWNAAEKCLIQGLNFLFAIIMARMLVPEDFGLVAMVTVFSGFLGRFIDGGLSSALIYSRDANEADKSSIFWVNIGIGAALSLVLWLCAPLIARFYNNSLLILITCLQAINFFLGSTTPVQLALFRKELNFKKMFYARLWALTVSGVVGIVMAYAGYGVWSIVTRILLMSSIFSLLLWLFSEWRPKLMFDPKRLKVLLSYSLPLLGSNVLSYVQKNLDTLIVGKCLGGGSLGIYNKSYQLMVLPGNQVTSMVGFVLFSSFAKFNHDKQKLWSTYVVVTKGILLFSIMISLTIYFVSESFVMNILGSQWVGAIAIIKIMALVGLIQPLARSVGVLFNSVGATGLAFKLSLIATPIYLVCIVVGALWGCRLLLSLRQKGDPPRDQTHSRSHGTLRSCWGRTIWLYRHAPPWLPLHAPQGHHWPGRQKTG